MDQPGGARTLVPSQSDSPPPLDPAIDFFAGTVAGVASLFCGHPFDTVRVRIQVRNGSGANAFSVARTILREEKFRGFFKGVLAPIWGVAAINASVFGVYGAAMRWQLADPKASPSLSQIAVAGGASGVVTSLLTTPIERLKILQQSAPVSSPPPTLRYLLRTLPVRSYYRGLSATILRDTAYAPYFITYELVSRGWPDDSPARYRADLVEEIECEAREVSWPRLLLAGGAAGIVGWGCTFPIDVIKSRIQASEPYLVSSASPAHRTAHPFRTIWSTAVNSYRAEGLRVFTAGLGPTLLRAVPVNMVCFLVFEAVVGALR